MDFFISRAGADAEEAIWIAEELGVAGYTTWRQEDFPLDMSIMEGMDIGAKCLYTIAVMSPEYFQSDYTKQEWQAAHYGKKLIQVKLRECDRPPLIAHHRYISFRGKTEEQKRKLLLDDVRRLVPEPKQVDVRKLMKAPHLIGRDEQLRILNEAWSGGKTRIVSIVAGGGVGKTSLAVEWWRRNRARGAARVLGWSFYSQGAGEGRQASAETFFDRAFRQWFAEENPPKDSWERGERLAELIRSERALLMLDGLEPIQQPDGSFKDPGMTSMLVALSADANAGMCVCTSRLPLTDLDTYASGEVLKMDLDNLSETDGAEYLRLLGAPGADLRAVSKEFGNHALALTLLGHYLANRGKLAEIPAQGEPASRVMRRYERVFSGRPELAVLRLLGLFDRPADPGAIAALRKMPFFAMSDADWKSALQNLYDARLIYQVAKDGNLDCHPLIREHFGADSFKEAHSRLFQYYSGQPPQQPNTLVEMTPLFYAVYHGCKAGRHQEACLCYRDRINRRVYNLSRQLGAFGVRLSLLANFFESPWTKPVSGLTPYDQWSVTAEASFSLRALGRLAEAVETMRLVAGAGVESEDWKNACISFGNLSELELALGAISEATASALRSVDLADRSGDRFQQIGKRTTLADTQHQSGQLDQAAQLFAEAEQMQAELPPVPILYSLRGYRYCEFLLAQCKSDDVLRRASQTIEWAKRHGSLLIVALEHLSLGRAHQPGSTDAATHLDQAVRGLRLSGQLDEIPRGLLARAANFRHIRDFPHTQRDLDQVRLLATRCGMRLHLTDYHLEQARLFLARSQPEPAAPHVTAARKLIAETGYHRRDAELADLESS